MIGEFAVGKSAQRCMPARVGILLNKKPKTRKKS
jgi:hypothetical protein